MPLPALLALVASLIFSADVRAENAAPLRRDLSISYKMISAELYEQTITDRLSMLSEAAIASMSQMSLPLNEHFQEWVSLEAATVKADGRRLVVPPENILLATAPNAAQMGIFQADVRTRTIVFPSVEVGDVLTYSRTIRTTKPVVPGGFDEVLSITPHAHYGDIRVELDAPSDMTFAIRRDGFDEKIVEAEGRRIYRWTLPAQPYLSPEQSSVFYVDYAPFVAFSNRDSDTTIGRYFYSVADDKAAVTTDVAKLADEITAGIVDRREQARAIYDHVSTKIRYFHIVIGQGGWVPHTADDVIKNGFGDCKDHVTLMRAMLAAKGIDAEFVLLSAGVPMYRSFDLPLSRYDHVILYLPAFDIYADPTSAQSAFDVVPVTVAGKNLLHISVDRVERRRGPKLKAADETVSIKASINVAADGRYSGSAIWQTRANQAMTVRRQLAQAGLKSRTEFMSDLIQRSNLRGKGALEAGRASDHAEPFKAEMTFEMENRLVASPQDRQPVPFGPSLIELPHYHYLRYARAGRKLDTLCLAQAYEIEADIHLHESFEFGAPPLPIRAVTDYGEFSSSYFADGKRLVVKRSWRIEPPGVTCTADQLRTKITPLVNAMSRDGGARLFIRRVERDDKAD